MLVAGWVAQGLAVAVDLLGIGQVQWAGRFGFAPALSLTHALVVMVMLAEARGRLWPQAHRGLAAAGVLVVGLALVFPGQPVVAHSPWAPLHWALGLASYGLVATAVLHAWLMQRSEKALRHADAAHAVPGWPLLRLERLTFLFLGLGVTVLGLALLMGWQMTPTWRWDHKTVFSLLAWSVLAGLLVGRQLLGWRGAQAVRWLYAGAALLLLSYAGSRFVLQVLLGRGT
jgi:ABC-type uncharacterized transport system permease subunit